MTNITRREALQLAGMDAPTVPPIGWDASSELPTPDQSPAV